MEKITYHTLLSHKSSILNSAFSNSTAKISLFGGHSQSGKWHLALKDIAQAAKSPLIDATLNQTIIRQLWIQTDLYLKTKRKATPEEVDAKLVTLIREESRKDFAVAACAQRLTAATLRGLLVEQMKEVSQNIFGASPYIQAVIVGHLINEHSVTREDYQLALDMLPFFRQDSADLRDVINIIFSGVSTNSLLYNVAASLAFHICRKFVSNLKSLASNHQWADACLKTSFLQDIRIKSSKLPKDSLKPDQILNKAFRAWQAWARWRPCASRLQLFAALNKEELTIFSDFIILEGPDVVTQTQPTLREGLVTNDSLSLSWGNTTVKLHSGKAIEAKQVLAKLTDALDRSCRGSVSDRKLFAYLFYRREIELDGLLLWEGITENQDPAMSATILRFFKADSHSIDKQYNAITNLVFALRDPSTGALRAHLAPFLARQATKVLETMQFMLCTQLEKRMLASAAERLQEFGAILREDDWLCIYFSQTIALLLHSWPSQEDIADLEVLRAVSQTQLPTNSSVFLKGIQAFLKNQLVVQGFIEQQTIRMVTTIMDLWRNNALNDDAKLLSIMLFQDCGPAWSLRFKCIAQIPTLSAPFLAVLRKALADNIQDLDQNCIDYSQALRSTDNEEVVQCWRPCLTRLLVNGDHTLVGNALEKLGPMGWMKWVQTMGILYKDIIETDNEALPTILRPMFHAWVNNLGLFTDAIEQHWKISELQQTIKTALLGFRLVHSLKHFVRIFAAMNKALQRYTQGPDRALVLDTLSRLTEDGKNAEDLCEAIEFMATANSWGMETCNHILDIFKHEIEINADRDQSDGATPVSGVILRALLHGPGLTEKDQRGLKAYGSLLGLHSSEVENYVSNGLDVAACYLEAEIAALLREARELESIRLGCKTIDPLGTTKLLFAIGIENPSRLDDELAVLPSDLLDLVEQVDRNIVELHFPLTSLTPLQRMGLGIENAQIMTVRLSFSDDAIDGFCIHFDDETVRIQKGRKHVPMTVLDINETELNSPICNISTNRISYQLSRVLFRYLQSSPPLLSDVHGAITSLIPNLGGQCLVCGLGHGDLRRATICQSAVCGSIWSRAHYNLLLSDLRQDPEVVDLLLTMVHTAAKSNNAALHPNCSIADPVKVLTLLAKLPSLRELKDSDDVYTALKARMHTYEPEAVELLIWILNGHRSFITSATGKLRIPSLPGTHQFLLANSNPEVEAAFAQRLGTQASMVLFHGTSPDRMLSILQTGLRNLSGTALQKHGASHGKGVYVAVEPSTSIKYSTAIPAPAGTGWRYSSFTNCKFLLGVEHAGPSTAKHTGIHVISDQHMVAVRYVFVLPASARTPIANHVAPAMGSVFASLRSKAL